MTTDISRYTRVVTLTIASGASETDKFDFSPFSGGIAFMPAAWTAADLGIETEPSGDGTGTFGLLRDDVGDAVKVTNIETASAEPRALPDAMFAAGWCKLQSINTSTEAGVNQAGARTIVLHLKG